MKVSNWTLGPSKYLTGCQAGRLLRTARMRMQQCRSKIAVRDYFIVHLALATGLRVMEIAALTCGDVFLDDRLSGILVQHGKGDKRRQVYFSKSFRRHCQIYLRWKQQIGERTTPTAPLLVSSNTGGTLTIRAIQKVFKRCAKRAGLFPSYSIHNLRHTHACLLLKASGWNVRLVQKQLGHARLSTTQIYADVMMPDLRKALNRMFV